MLEVVYIYIPIKFLKGNVFKYHKIFVKKLKKENNKNKDTYEK